MFFCQSRMHCSLIVFCTDRKCFSFAKRCLVAVFSGVILLVCGAPSILYGQDAALFETWTKVESSPETKAYTEALKAGGAFDGKHQAHFLENVLPQLELQSNRPQIERVRKRIRDVFLVPITSPAAFDAAQAAVVLYASQAAASDDFDMAVRVNAVLLIGDLRTAKQEPWPSAGDAIVTIATNIDLPLAIRASAMPGLFRHASSAGNPEGRKAITAAAFTIIAETTPDTQQTAHEWLQSKAMASLRVIGSPLTESDATNILAALNNSQAGLNLRVRCASLLGALADRDTIVTVGVGQHQMWSAQFFKFRNPRKWLSSSGLGTMGFGLPAAIGAKVAHPESLVVDIDGDGSILMNIQEMATCHCEQIPVKVLLLNNQHLGMVVQWEDRFFKGNRAHTYLGPVHHPEAFGKGDGIGPQDRYPDFVEIAKGFGWHAQSVSKKADLESAILALINAPGPAILDVQVPYQEHVLPMIPSGMTVRDLIKR